MPECHLGTLYGVGIGPGDPELMTLKAVRLLKAADVIAIPDARGKSRIAWEVVRDVVGDKAVLDCPAPMTRDKAQVDAAWDRNADNVCALLDRGKDVAFVTLGDPSIYSTYWYLHQRVQARGYPARMVPGVPSFCAAAAGLNTALCEGSEPLLIVPASYPGLADSLDVEANKVLMKAGRQLEAVKDALGERHELDRASLAVNCGMDGERYEPDFANADTDAGYFSIVLVKMREKE